MSVIQNFTQNYLVHSPTVIFVLGCIFIVGVERKSQSIIYISIILVLSCLFFFRPYLDIPSLNPNILVCPAEGHIQEIEHDTINKTITVKIYLSIIDKHVQICPMNGKVKSQMYTTGTFHPAYMFEKSKYNERNEIVFKTLHGEVSVTQIAGVMVRRIKSFVDTRETIAKGTPIGIIKFGSRCDIKFKDSGKLLVQLGQYVKLGQDLYIF